jgi:hypothetical protein
MIEDGLPVLVDRIKQMIEDVEASNESKLILDTF